jgi:hypothetical protein
MRVHPSYLVIAHASGISVAVWTNSSEMATRIAFVVELTVVWAWFATFTYGAWPNLVADSGAAQPSMHLYCLDSTFCSCMCRVLVYWEGRRFAKRRTSI